MKCVKSFWQRYAIFLTFHYFTTDLRTGSKMRNGEKIKDNMNHEKKKFF